MLRPITFGISLDQEDQYQLPQVSILVIITEQFWCHLKQNSYRLHSFTHQGVLHMMGTCEE